MTTNGDRLLARVLAGEDGAIANQLLTEFFGDYPVERLTVLLNSKTDEAVKTGAWLASELAGRVGRLVPELSGHLNHPDPSVRYFVVESILTSADNRHGEALARAVGMTSDPDAGVRWKAFQFLTLATEAQLRASLPYLPDGELRTLTSWLLEIEGNASELDAIRTKLNSANPVSRVFATAAAARVPDPDHEVLRDATSSPDPEVSRLARRALDATGRVS